MHKCMSVLFDDRLVSSAVTDIFIGVKYRYIWSSVLRVLILSN